MAVTKSNFFLNRELSLLAFNQRVLEEAQDINKPLMERLKFLSIFNQNLDEFFMVKVASLRKIQQRGLERSESPDQMLIKELIPIISSKVEELVSLQYKVFEKIFKELAQQDIHLLEKKNWDKKDKAQLAQIFTEMIFPVLTPLAVDQSHPFPFLSNLGLYILVEFNELDLNGAPLMGFVEIPHSLPRLMQLDGPERMALLDDVIEDNLEMLFLGYTVKKSYQIKVTRNLDYYLLESNVLDLLESVREEVRSRELNEAVRLEVSQDLPAEYIALLKDRFRLSAEDIYQVPGPLGLNRLCEFKIPKQEHLYESAFNPRLPARLNSEQSIFSIVREQDLLVHHPYESFYTVLEFVRAAAVDPKVLAIKLTLYRSSEDSPLIKNLIMAARNGKHVTICVELKARFDEVNNIEWAEKLEKAGLNIVYGFVKLKTHCKVCLVVRKEHKKIARYAHFSTGNYHPQTAAAYSDISLFTANEQITQDALALFNLLTGFHHFSQKGESYEKHFPVFHHIKVAPFYLRKVLLKEIDRLISAKNKDSKKEVRFIGKMNHLEDEELILKLYEASQAGVSIRLLVRGICCLRPGDPKLSKNIEIYSLVDRFLEHSRIFCFRDGQESRAYISSADWMRRNMDKRIEVMVPVLDEELKKRLEEEILPTYFADNIQIRKLQTDGTYVKVTRGKGKETIRAQQLFIDTARDQGLKSLPYSKVMKNPTRLGYRPIVKKKAK